MAIPVDPQGRLQWAADKLLTEIGFYALRVSKIVPEEFMPSSIDLDAAIAEVAALIYQDDEAA
jgi:hypothetical protein